MKFAIAQLLFSCCLNVYKRGYRDIILHCIYTKINQQEWFEVSTPETRLPSHRRLQSLFSYV